MNMLTPQVVLINRHKGAIDSPDSPEARLEPGSPDIKVWLVVSNHGILFSISYMGYIILPIDELHRFSRWLLHHQLQTADIMTINGGSLKWGVPQIIQNYIVEWWNPQSSIVPS